MVEQLLQELNREYGVKAISLKPVGPVWKVTAADGEFALKKTTNNAGQIEQTASYLWKLTSSGFMNVSPYLPTRSGGHTFHYLNHCYHLSRWINGPNPTFSKQTEVKEVARLFGDLHHQSSIIIKVSKKDLPGPQESLLEKYHFLKELNFDNPPTSLNRVDRQIRKWRGYFLKQAEFCLTELERLHFSKWLASSAQAGFCHNDPAPRNIIIENRRLTLIDFDLAGIDWFLAELTHLCLRVLKANHWEEKLLDLLIQAYSTTRPVTEAEVAFIPVLLLFPQGFWRICHQRYQERLPWTEKRFARRLWGILAEEKERLECLGRLLPLFKND